LQIVKRSGDLLQIPRHESKLPGWALTGSLIRLAQWGDRKLSCTTVDEETALVVSETE
jgi:hypothetical protein